jgi:hypothetical protein
MTFHIPPMRYTSACMIHNVHIEGHQPRVCIRTVCLPQLLRLSVLHKSELNTDKTNNAYIYNY